MWKLAVKMLVTEYLLQAIIIVPDICDGEDEDFSRGKAESETALQPGHLSQQQLLHCTVRTMHCKQNK